MRINITKTSTGFHEPNFAWFYILPLAAAVFVGLRGAGIWLVITLAITLGFWSLEGFGVSLPNRIPQEMRSAQALFNRVTAILGLCVFPTIFRLEWISQAFHRTNVYGVLEFSIQALYASLVVTTIVLSMNLWAVAASRLIAEIIVAATLFVWVSRNFSPVDFDYRNHNFGMMARASAPIAGTQFLRGLCFASDFIILGLLVSATDLGHYVPGFRIFMFAVALISAYSVILFPRIAAHAGSLSDAMAREVRRSLRLTIPAVLVGAGLLAALAHPILVLLFDSEYTHGRVSLQILCIALVINLLNRHYRQVLIARGRQRTDLALTAMGTLVHIAGKFAFIPFMGIAGAAWGTVVGELFLLAALRRAALPVLRLRE